LNWEKSGKGETYLRKGDSNLGHRGKEDDLKSLNHPTRKRKGINQIDLTNP